MMIEPDRHFVNGFSGGSEETILTAITYWYKLAQEERARKAWDASLGHATPAHDARIRTYEETARSLRLELETGVPYCSCCLKPLRAKER